MRKGYSKIATALIFCAAFILVVLGFQTLDVINITNGNNNQQQGGGTGGGSQYEDNNDKIEAETGKSTIEIKVEDVSKNYDGTPLEPGETEYLVKGKNKLKKGHYIELAEVNQSLTNCGTVTSDNKFVIKDQDDKDVTDEYTLIVKQGKITIDPLRVNIKIKNNILQKDYDANPFELTNDDFVITGLENQNVKVTPILDEVFEEVGKYNTKIKFKFEDENNNDISQNYIYNSDDIYTVIINKIDLNFDCDDLSKEYDGKPLEYTKLSQCNPENVDKKLLKNHDLVFANSEKKLVDAGEDDSIAFFKVIDEYGTDVSRNYNFIVKPGKLKITQKKLNFISIDFSKIYDGNNYQINNNNITGLIEGDKITISLDNAQKDSGKYNSNVKFNIINKDNEDVTKNYSLTQTNIDYSISKRIVNLDFSNLEIPYTKNQYELEDNVTNKLNKYLESIKETYGHDLRIKHIDPIIGAGEYNFEIASDDPNYDIQTPFGHFVVKPVIINLKLPTIVINYSSQISEDLFNKFKEEFKKINMDKKDVIELNDFELHIDSFMNQFNACGTFKLDENLINNLGYDKNYQFNYKNGQIKINKGKINVTLDTGFLYDNDIYNAEQFVIKDKYFTLEETVNDKDAPNKILNKNSYQIKNVVYETPMFSTADVEKAKNIIRIKSMDIVNNDNHNLDNFYRIDLSGAFYDDSKDGFLLSNLFKKRNIFISFSEILIDDPKNITPAQLKANILVGATSFCNGDYLTFSQDDIEVDGSGKFGFIKNYKILNINGDKVTNYYKINDSTSIEPLKFYIRRKR